MSQYDHIFYQNLKEILVNKDNMTDSRAIWEDENTIAQTCKKFGIVNRYNSDYSNQPPIGTIRKFPIKNCIDEILWIWQKKSNNIKDLKSHIWDSWADEKGSIGAAYGFQVANKIRTVKHDIPEGENIFCTVHEFADQTDYVIHELKHNPTSRRIITNLYSVNETGLMGLDPCCFLCNWNVTFRDGKKYLNLLLTQRSQDMIVANNWNVFQYWILQNMFANEADMEVGELVHVIADAHIYDRHIPIAVHMMGLYVKNYNFIQDTNPRVVIPKKLFYEYTVDDFELLNYDYLENITNIPVAV